MALQILTGFAFALLWLLSLLIKPFGRCIWCRGRRVLLNGRRASRCWLCKGLGRRQRLGSRTVHRIRRAAVAGWRGRQDRAA